MSRNNTASTYNGSFAILWFILGSFCSYMINHSVGWAIFHGLCGGFYLIYLCMGFGGGFSTVDENLDKMLSARQTSTEQAPVDQETE